MKGKYKKWFDWKNVLDLWCGTILGCVPTSRMGTKGTGVMRSRTDRDKSAGNNGAAIDKFEHVINRAL